MNPYKAFERNFKKNNKKVAISYNNEKISYNKLLENIDKISNFLANKEIYNQKKIIIFGYSNIEFISSLLACYKNNCIYIPIDANQPIERIKYIISNSDADVFLSCIGDTKFKLDVEIINIQQILTRNIEVNNNKILFSKMDISYIVYTSGTTGTPKGVEITLENIYNLIQYFDDLKFYDYQNLRFSVWSSISFDVSILEIFSWIYFGGTLYIPIQEIRYNSNLFINWIIKNKINCSFLPNFMLQSTFIEKDLSCIKSLICGVEPLKSNVLTGFLNRKTKVVYGYGPSETTIYSMLLYLDNINDIKNFNMLPLGEPIQKTKIKIIREDGSTVYQEGEEGELYIGGKGVSNGYLKNKKLTNEKFVKIDGITYYKSGDIVIKKKNEIYYCGRIDDQIKLRGHRIELSEIDNVIRNIFPLSEVCTIFLKEKELLVTFMETKEKKIDIKKKLVNHIPRYSMPNKYYCIERLPRNINGKIDKKQLINIAEKQLSKKTAFNSTNPTEKLVYNTIKSVLKNQNFSLNEDFFSIGGNSLQATEIVMILNKKLSKKLQIKDLFESETLYSFVNIVNKIEKKQTYSKKIENNSFYLCTEKQTDIYNYQIENKNSIHYNISNLYKINNNIDIKKMKENIEKLVLKNEIFNLNFFKKAKKLYFKKAKKAKFNVEIVNFNNEFKNITEYVYSENIPFNLEKDKLIKIKIINFNSTNYLILYVHHIIMDGVSIDKFIEWIVKAYNEQFDFDEISQFSEYILERQHFFDEKEREKQKKYWINKFDEGLTWNSISNNQSFENKTDIFIGQINETLTLKINDYCKKNKISVFSFLISNYMIVLAYYYSQNKISVGFPIYEQTSNNKNALGFFVNTVSLYYEFNYNEYIYNFLQNVQIQLYDIMENKNFPITALKNELTKMDKIKDNTIYTSNFILQNYNNNNIKNKFIHEIYLPRNNSNIDMLWELFSIDDIYECKIRYNFQKGIFYGFIEEMFHFYIRTIEVIINNHKNKTNKSIGDVLSDVFDDLH